MKRIISLALCVLVLCVSAITPGFAAFNAALETSADIVLLLNRDSGTVVFDKNADKVTAPASLTKIATATVAIEHCADLDAKVTVKQSSIDAIAGTNSSTAGLLPGEVLTVRELLYCLLVRSANEAAVILADYVGNGSVPAFVDMMNELAASLGCENTHFVNPHGLDEPGHQSTARDIAKLTEHALELPLFSEIVNTVNYTLPATNKSGERNLLSTNWLINPNFKTYYCEYAAGVKTGSTSDAGRCVVSTASKDGYNYLGVVMGAPYEDVNGDGNPDNCAFLECKKIFEWAFDNLRMSKVADTTRIVTVVDVTLSRKADHVRLVPASDVTALVPVGNNENSVLIEPIPEETPQSVEAPVKKGDVLGKARILYAESEIATIDLVAAEDVDVSLLLYIGHGISQLFRSAVFLVIFALVLLVLAVYGFLVLRHKQQKKRRRAPKTVKNFRNLK